MTSALLHTLASAAGIDPEYTSWRGQRVTSSDESLLAGLRTLAPTLGFELNGPEDAAGALAQLHRARWDERVPSVVYGWDGSLTIPLAVPAEVDGDWELDITSETGVHVHQAGRLFHLPADSHTWPDNIVHCIRRVHVPCAIGYHSVAWKVGDASGESFGIAAPSKAYGGPGQGERRWGVFAPVYGLSSIASGETGDLGTLRQLFEAVARRGGRYVATLPILAAGADQISPYSPVSRRFWNELYLDLAALAAEAGLPAPIAPAITGGLIDYRAQRAWRDV
ncbi:MAG: 4-alpha-glucanotransferase, partial [Deltaproteobacteria bacterium]|nr:4-alpha-glucanotransferase [Deltaproteobacteria bacterium]